MFRLAECMEVRLWMQGGHTQGWFTALPTIGASDHRRLVSKGPVRVLRTGLPGLPLG